jgi:hypothetical protein
LLFEEFVALLIITSDSWLSLYSSIILDFTTYNFALPYLKSKMATTGTECEYFLCKSIVSKE